MIYSRGVNLNGKFKDYKSYPAPLYPAFSKIPMLEATFFYSAGKGISTHDITYLSKLHFLCRGRTPGSLCVEFQG